MLLAQKIHLVHADTVLAGAGPVHCQCARNDQLVQALGLGELFRLRCVGKNRAMKISVAYMTKNRGWQERLLGVANGTGDALREARDWHAHVSGKAAASRL